MSDFKVAFDLFTSSYVKGYPALQFMLRVKNPDTRKIIRNLFKIHNKCNRLQIFQPISCHCLYLLQGVSGKHQNK